MSRRRTITVNTLSGSTKAWNYNVMGSPNGSNGVVTDGTNQNRVNNSKNETTTIGALSLTYDNDGNLITDPVDGGGNLTYDAWGNRQTSATCSASYAYDALGRRITATEPDYYTGGTQISKTHQEYYSTDWQVLEDRQTYTPPGMCTQVTDVDQYVWGQGYVDDLVLRDRTVSGTTTRTYVQQDANHNVTALISTSGTVLERFVYDPYGKATALNASWAVITGWTPATDSNAWRYYFQGGRYETGTGLYNFRNRDYSPLMGTWVEADPSGYADGLNLYQYESSGPPGRQDPMGLSARGGAVRADHAENAIKANLANGGVTADGSGTVEAYTDGTIVGEDGRPFAFPPAIWIQYTPFDNEHHNIVFLQLGLRYKEVGPPDNPQLPPNGWIQSKNGGYWWLNNWYVDVSLGSALPWYKPQVPIFFHGTAMYDAPEPLGGAGVVDEFADYDTFVVLLSDDGKHGQIIFEVDWQAKWDANGKESMSVVRSVAGSDAPAQVYDDTLWGAYNKPPPGATQQDRDRWKNPLYKPPGRGRPNPKR
jgi:RHS repeat-associated protein